ncbi:hypothetical protein Ahy_B01g054783 [Arachis hypogaea]|uniref:Uncharacterized protein n=1 Tax=Arachis hypogaea TaxID=3818 RepID=A0A445AUD1_ARAHY|nr:hypothetical protein Ahy_B01g054783 [Arachis hypogaea]
MDRAEHYYPVSRLFCILKCSAVSFIGLDDPETILEPLANKLRPTIISSWMDKRKALLTENADIMK